jgi:hypothetical protein
VSSAVVGGIERSFAACPPGRVRYSIPRPAADAVAAALPARHRIPNFPTWHDQGRLPTCVEQSIAERYEHLTGEAHSALFGFYFARQAEGDKPTEIVGLSIPDALAVAQWQGLCLERTWPYVEDAYAVAPPVNAIVEARARRLLRSDPVADLLHLKEHVASGQPVMLGFEVPTSISADVTAQNGIVQVPDVLMDPVIGRHAVNAVAYDDSRKLVGVTAHWGPAWGDDGLAWLPYAFWTLGHVHDMYTMLAVSRGGSLSVA